MNRNFFTFDNLNGEYKLLQADLRLGTPTAVFGVSDSQKYLTASVLEGRVLYIAADSIAAGKAYAAISVLSGKKCAYIPAKDDILLFKEAASKDAVFRRIEGINALFSGAEIIISEPDALCQLFPDKLPRIDLKKGGECEYASLPARLVEMGYTREYSVESKGAFAVRGDILDIFPVGSEKIRSAQRSAGNTDDADNGFGTTRETNIHHPEKPASQ